MEIADKTFRKSCYHICNKISPLKFESVKKKKNDVISRQETTKI